MTGHSKNTFHTLLPFSTTERMDEFTVERRGRINFFE